VNLPEGDIDPVSFSMTNINGESAAWDFNVLGVNDAPEAHASVQIALIDTAVSAAEETNATDRDRGDVLSAAVKSVSAPAFQDAPAGIETIVPTGADFSGWLTFDSAAEEYRFEVPEDVDFLKQLPIGAKFILTYTCTVTDKLGATTEETVVVTVTGTNQAPVAEAIDETYTAVPDAATPIVLEIPCGGEDIDYSDTVALATVTIGGTTYTIDWETGQFAPGESSVEVAGYGTYTLDTANRKLLYTLAGDYSEQLRWTTPAGETAAIELGGLEYQMADNHGALSEGAAVSYTYVGAFDKLQFVNIPDQEVNALGTETGWATLDEKITFHSDAGQTYAFSVKEIKNDEHTLDAASLLRFADPVYGPDGSIELQVNRDALATIPAEWYGDYTVTFEYANTDTAAHADDAGQQTFTLSIVGYTITVTPAVIEGGTLTEDQVYTPETGYQAAVDLTTKIVSVTAHKSGGVEATVDSYDFATTLRLDDVSGAGAADLTDAEKAHLLSCASIDSAGNFLFRLDTAASEMLQYLAEGDSLTMSFGYSLTNLVIDGEAIAGTLRGGDVTVMITGVNDAPVAHGTVDIALSDVDAAASASSKVTDADTPAEELVYTLNSYPSGDDVVFSGNAPAGIAAIVEGADFSTWLTWDAAGQKYVFTPGSEVFKALPEAVTATLAYSFQVSDGKGAATIEDIQVTITGTNQAPTAQDLSASVNAGDSVVIDWRANSNDIDFKDPVTLVKLNDVAVTATEANPQVIDLYDNDQYVGYLTVSVVEGEQVLTYTAAGNALKWDLAKGDTRGIDFTYQVSDGRLTSDTADAAVEVVGRFDPLEMDPENPTTLKITNKSPAVEGWIPATEQLGFFSDMLPGGERESYSFTVTKANDDTDLAQYFKMETTGGKVTLYVEQSAVTGPSPILPPGDYVLAFTSENLDGEADVQDHTINLTIQDKSGVEAAAIDLPAITEDVALISKDLSENTFIDPDKATATVTDVRFKTLGELPVHTVTLTDSTGTYTGEQIKDHLGWTADRYTAFVQKLSEAASVDGTSNTFTFTNDGTFLNFLAEGAELHVTYHYTIDGYTSDGVVWDVPSTNNPITVNITGINDAPYGAADHTASVDLTTGAVVYDTGSATLNIFDGVVDPEGRSLTTTWVVPATVTAYGTTFTISEGAITVAADGTVSIDADKLTGDFVKLGLGQSAEIVVKFTISDDLGLVVAEGERSLTVTVLGKNEAPTKKADAPTGSANIEESTSTAAVSITPAMFAEDIDLNDTTLYFQSVTVEGTTITPQTAGWSGNTFTQAFASGATLTLVKDASGITSCSYNVAGRAERIPNLPAGQTAADSISFVVCDKAGAATESISYDFNVIGVNDAPYGAADHTANVNLINQTVKYDTNKDTLNVLDGVVDPDGNTLSVTNVTVPTSVTAYGHTFEISPGAISIASTGEVSIGLAALTDDFVKLAQDGTVTIPVTFLVKDSAGASVKEGIKTVTVTVVGRNEAPTASATLTATVDLAAGTQTVLDLTAGASDLDIGDTIPTAAVASITYQDGGTVKELPADCWSLSDSKTVVFDIAKLRALFPKLAIGSTVSLAVNFTVADNHGASSEAATASVTVEGWYEAPRFVAAYTVQTTHFAYADGSYDGILTLPL
ncbi:MAG: VCBS domain-containing protein, partial [Thermoguttaceae bacterium]|nr:VCBS domain-containing protein [Thermoguttaceae bacterium]